MNIDKYTRSEILNFNSREYAPDRKDLDKKCDLSLNINPCGVSERVILKLKSIDSKKLSHYYLENKELLNEIASYVKANPEQIMLGDGCDGCLQMIANTFINKGEEVIIPIPTFHRYEFHTILMGGKPIFVPMINFELNFKDILKKANKNSKILFLCDPNNPTGISIEKTVKEELIKNFNGIVVIDEALADITDVNGTSLLKKYDNLIIVRSFSKSFGLASLRIGYIISNPKIIEQIKKTSSPFKVNGVAQELALEALKDKDYIKSSIEYINKNRIFLISNLEKIGLKCTNSITTNFLADISNISKDSTELVEKLKERGILITDAKAFRVPRNIYIRISVATEEENFQFINVLSELKNSKV